MRAALSSKPNERCTRAKTISSLIGRFEFDTPPGATSADQDVQEEGVPTIADSYRLAQEHYPALQNARATLEVARLDVDFARNDLLPSLDLDFAVGFNGDDRTRRGAFSGITEPDGHTWQAGLELTYPLGRARRKRAFRQSATR